MVSKQYGLLRVLVISAVVLLLGACQSAPPRKSNVTAVERSPGKSHNGIHGVKANIESRQFICRSPVNIPGRRYGRLSYKAKRRFMYDYVTGIRTRIRSRWLKPDGVGLGESCTVRIRQRIDGCVKQVSFKECRHFKMRSTVRRAVMKASPLPQAPHPALFSDDIILTFKVR